MSVGLFNCDRCGHCCRNLLQPQDDGTLLGLALLTAQEKALFKDVDVVPYTAVGKDSPREILMYQVKNNVCPHINRNNECLIYSKRPLACRAYPIVNTIGKKIVDLECPQVSKYTPDELRQVGFPDELGEAMTIINKLIKKSLRKEHGNHTLWRFDVATKKWHIEH